MPTNLPIRGNTLISPRSFVAQVVVTALGAVVTAFIVYMIINGPTLRAEAEHQRAQEIELENTFFCEKLGMVRGTDSFATCASYLTDIRKRHYERIRRDFEPIL